MIVDMLPTPLLARVPAWAVLAHQGGWDEILWVMIPIVVMVGLLRVAARRVRNNADAASDARDVGAE
ncbi:MAG: hypothetical protein KJS66_03080 [Acidobacteria bacterium]|nr:hypothetical protein [Acidobacteriota bacterium]